MCPSRVRVLAYIAMVNLSADRTTNLPPRERSERQRRALRIDDLGASSKRFEIYSKRRWANVGPLKWIRPWKAWGPYRELKPEEINHICGLVEAWGSRLTLAITACWVEANNRCVPYPDKFPRQAEVVKHWVRRGTVEVACHGLTHCRPGLHRPRFWTGNRQYHREFFPGQWSSNVVARLALADEIYFRWLGVMPRILVPPGLQFPSSIPRDLMPQRVWTRKDDERVLALHDRDFVLGDGLDVLQAALREEQFVTCGELP